MRFTGGANRGPIAVAHGLADQRRACRSTSNFDGSASSDPDGDPLTYDWDFGDGSPREAGPTTSTRTTTAGTYTATLTVRDAAAAIDVDTHPDRRRATFHRRRASTSPAADKRFARRRDDHAHRAARPTPRTARWPARRSPGRCVKHHATHTHPFLPPTTGSDVSITAPIPEDFASTTNSYLEIQLTATDSQGLSHTVTQDLSRRSWT